MRSQRLPDGANAPSSPKETGKAKPSVYGGLPLRSCDDDLRYALRGIKRSTGVYHNTVINWVREILSQIPEDNYEIPETVQLDELQTFVGSKKTKFGSGQQ